MCWQRGDKARMNGLLPSFASSGHLVAWKEETLKKNGTVTPEVPYKGPSTPL